MTALDVTAQRDRLNLAPAVKAALEQAVQAPLAALQEQARQDAEPLQAKDAASHAKDLKIQALTLERAQPRRLRYGAKSEALSQVHWDLFEETWNTDLAAVAAEVEPVANEPPGPTGALRQRRRAGRQPLPAHLPRIEHRHEPDACQCGHCGRDWAPIGEDITAQLDVEPAMVGVKI